MTREIILVEVVDKNTISTDYCKAFTDSYKAEDYFRSLVSKFNVTDDEQDISAFLDNGFCDFDFFGEPMSIIIKTISFDCDWFNL